MTKAKKNDLIRSLNVFGMPDRGYFAGVVTKVQVDNKDGVEYVYYTAIVENRAGENREVFKQMRVPQNGTSSTFEGLTNNIVIL